MIKGITTSFSVSLQRVIEAGRHNPRILLSAQELINNITCVAMRAPVETRFLHRKLVPYFEPGSQRYGELDKVLMRSKRATAHLRFARITLIQVVIYFRGDRNRLLGELNVIFGEHGGPVQIDWSWSE